MNNSPFRLLEGGRKEKKYLSGWVTDCRLMGVTVMGLRLLEEGPEGAECLQLFYFDTAELGFDRFDELKDPDPREAEDLILSYVGGLGCGRVAITEREAAFQLNFYVLFNRERGLPLPGEYAAYSFLLGEEESLSREEQDAFFAKQCVRPSSRAELTNYFLMRYAENDDRGLRHLSGGRIRAEDIGEKPMLNLFANDLTVDEAEDRVTAKALIGYEEGYEILVTELGFEGEQVASFEVRERMKISDREAYFVLSHPEFVTIYGILGSGHHLERHTSALTMNATFRETEVLESCMIFRTNNDHVNKEHYRMYEDVLGVYALADGGRQLVACSNTEEGIERLEQDLRGSVFSELLRVYGRFEFNEPVLLQFIESGYENFMEFLEDIRVD